MPFKILVINPGGSSTRIAVFDNEVILFNVNITHSQEDLNEFTTNLHQLEFRTKAVLSELKEKNIKLNELNAVIGRGAPFHPLEFGVYPINQAMLYDLKEGNLQEDHISVLGGLIAFDIAQKAGNILSYIADPISVRQGFLPEAEITGLGKIKRKSLSHALNIRYVATKVSKKLNGKITDFNFIVAHLGTGFSICVLAGGNILDVNNANAGGPFSPQRSGHLPVTDFVDYVYKLFQEGKGAKEIKSKLVKKSGLFDLLETDDLKEIEQLILKGNKNAELVLSAMAYQIAKEIGAMTTTLKGQIDGIIITGGCAHSDSFINKYLIPHLMWLVSIIEARHQNEEITHIHIIPGEGEMEALAAAALRVLNEEEETKEYIGWNDYY